MLRGMGMRGRFLFVAMVLAAASAACVGPGVDPPAQGGGGGGLGGFGGLGGSAGSGGSGGFGGSAGSGGQQGMDAGQQDSGVDSDAGALDGSDDDAGS